MKTESGIEELVLEGSHVTIEQNPPGNKHADWQKIVQYSDPKSEGDVQKRNNMLVFKNYSGKVSIFTSDDILISGEDSTLEGSLHNAKVDMYGSKNNVNVKIDNPNKSKKSSFFGYLKECTIMGALTITGYTALNAIGANPNQYLDWLAVATLGAWGGWKGDRKTWVGSTLVAMGVIYGDDIVQTLKSATPSVGFKELFQTGFIFASHFAGEKLRTRMYNSTRNY